MGKDTNQNRLYGKERDEIAEEMALIIKNLYKIEDYIGKAISRKALLKRAGKVVLTTMKEKAPVDSGRLKESITFMAFRKSKNAIFVGPQYYRKYTAGGDPANVTAPHAHLVEYGFVTRNGSKVPGRPFIKQTYQQTKEIVLKNLQNEIQFLIDKSVSGVKRRPKAI